MITVREQNNELAAFHAERVVVDQDKFNKVRGYLYANGIIRRELDRVTVGVFRQITGLDNDDLETFTQEKFKRGG